MNRLARWLFVAILMALASVAIADEIEDGRRIYQEGILPDGRPLTGLRFGNVTVSGRDAACITCHRRSGMGSVEGETQVPPITGRFLFDDPVDKPFAVLDRRSGRSMNLRHPPYTEEVLLATLRCGVNNQGRPMEVVMPRYGLSDSEGHALVAYLRRLSAEWSPGVTDHTIRFATVITPQISPARKEALLATLRAAFAQKNGSTVTARAGGRRHMVSAAEMVLGTERNWLLDVWELRGEPSTWGAQLDESYRAAPVFALVSGGSDGTWQPVHEFCESHQLPCWFPSVGAPPQDPGLYSLYFNRGVGLEADVVSGYLQGRHAARLVQIRRDDEAARAAAARLAARWRGPQEVRTLDTTPDALATSLRDVRPGDAVMLWLHREDLGGVATLKPPTGVLFCASGELLNADLQAIPALWRGRIHVVYPFELPQRRQANMEYFRAWVAIRHLPVTDEALQSESWFAVDYLSSTMAEMLDNLYRDYLVERAEEMLGRSEGGKSEEQTRLVPLGGPLTNRPRAGTTIYPHLNLAPGQRFASRGAWMVRFEGDEPVAETEWIVPE